MLSEVIDNLNIKEDGVYVDATLGYAGHSSEILKRLKRGFLFAFDQDKEAIIYSEKKLSEISLNFKIIHSNFENLKEELEKENISKVDGILFDLGLSSPQIDDASRGFSFMSDAKLDMRMNKESKKSAYEVVNNYSKEELTKIFFEYGEEKLSSSIARKIVDARKTKPITTTTELVEIIKSSTGANYFYKNHPEREIFQAIRIEVNDELKVLEKVLPDAIDLLNIGGRITVITFHSLEDRIVKKVFKKYSEVDQIFKGMPDVPEMYKPKIKLINKKPLLPSEKELNENSRSRSAKLRIIERI
jgi:16S rRNA (cytosine1402-N4)-methyltransferase